jgi:hypothetical protein
MLVFARARLFPRDATAIGLFAMPTRPAAVQAVYVDGPEHVLVLAQVRTPADMLDVLRSLFPGARHVELEERRVVRPLGVMTRLDPGDRDDADRALSMSQGE